MKDLKTVKDNIDQVFEQAKSSSDPNIYLRLGNFLEDLKSNLRERLQENTKSEIQNILRKLEAGENLLSGDIDLLRLWVVGEAQTYVETENNFDDWVRDLGRVVAEIKAVPDGSLNLQKILQLKGLAHDGRRSVADIMNYLEKKERVRLFEESIGDLKDSEKRAHLIGILKYKMISPDN